MKKVNLFFLAALAVILLTGCKGDEPETQQLYKVGDYYPDPKAVYSDGVLKSGTAAIGIVYWLDTAAPGYKSATKGGPSGKIVSLDEGNFLAWGPYGVEIGATSLTDGLANMAAVKRIDNTFSAYPAFAWVDQKNGVAGATTYASGDKGKWYLPAVAELQYLLCAAVGKPYETWGFQGGDDSGIYSYLPSFNQEANRIDLSSFNAKLTSEGVLPFSADGYWSSTEDNTSGAWLMDFYNGNTANYFSKTYNGIRVRCVREF